MLDRIPHISWQDCEDLFRPEDEVDAVLKPDDYGFIPDIDDRKFAALAELAACPLVTSDSDLLSNRHRLSVPVLTPREFLATGR
jgi:predicted nucleic acid-binding protein